jgi:AcrR family transcriptional regulator
VALELFTERGFDEVTVDDIASAAGISRRTFFRYFESKEDAALPYEEERLETLRSLLAARPPDEPVLAGVRHATVEIVASVATDPAAREEGLRRTRIVAECPSVHARSLELQSRWEIAIREMIAEHLGVEAATSLEAHVVAGASLAAVRAAVQLWLATDGATELADLVGEAFDLLTTDLSFG